MQMKVYHFIGRMEAYMAKVALVTMVFLIFIAAVSRTLGYPIIWSVDAATFLFAWCVFFSADVAMREDRLVRVEIVTNLLPDKYRSFVQVLNYIIIIVFLAALIGYGVLISYTTRYRTFQGIPGFSYTWVTISVPIGCSLMLTTCVLKVRALVKSLKSTLPAASCH